jgi:hypothetical protein
MIRPPHKPRIASRPTVDALISAGWAVWQLADDPGTYGDDANKHIVVTDDGEHEITGVVELEIAERIVDDHNNSMEKRT